MTEAVKIPERSQIPVEETKAWLMMGSPCSTLTLGVPSPTSLGAGRSCTLE